MLCCISHMNMMSLASIGALRSAVLLVAVAMLAACASSPPTSAPLAAAPSAVAPAPTPATSAMEPIDTLGLVAYAASMQGKPYIAGGESPHQGFDCSGLVHHVFKQFNFELPRNSSAIAEQLDPIPLDNLRAADLVFFNTQGSRYSHVGIYLGDGRFVHAPSPRTGRVIISSMDNRYWNGHLSGARRPEP